MKYEELIELCLQIVTQFNPIKQTVDSFSEEFIHANRKKLHDTEAVFLKQIFFGIYRYEQFLKILTQALFTQNPAQTNRSDGPLYHIFSYIICFRLDEIPFHEFKKMIQSQDAVKMNVFLQFLFDFEKLNQFVRPQWIEIYDIAYIDNNIIGFLEEKLQIMAEILDFMSEKATGKRSDIVQTMEDTQNQTDKQGDKSKKKKDPTVPEPFQLTQPKPKKIPEPIKIPKKIEIKQVPKCLNKTSVQQIEQEKKQRREQLKENIIKSYEEAKEKPFDFQLDKRPTNIQKITKEVEEERKKELQFNSKYYTPIPDYSKEQSEVKLNIAAVLREEKKIKEFQQQQEQKLKDLEWNMRDSAEFENWKYEMKEKDKYENIEHKQRKKIEMELAREAAMKACEEKTQENKEVVEHMKKISVLKQQEKEENVKVDWEKKHHLIETVLETRDNAAQEKIKLLEKNKKVADDNKKEMEILNHKKKEEAEVERKKREEIIKQIYDMDRQEKKKVQEFDRTETMGYGLLAEMSLLELEQRLVEVKEKQKQETEKNRQENMQRKDEQLNSLQKKVQLIKDQRNNLQQQKQNEREEKKRKEIEEKRRFQEIKEKSLLEVQNKISDKKKAKKKEEDRLAKEFHEIKLKRQYMNANAAIVEEKAWKSLQDGAERELKTYQIDKLVEQEKIESINLKEQKILAHTAKREVENKINFNWQYDERLEKANKENEVLQRTLREYKKAVHEDILKYEQDHKQNMIERDPYKYALSEFSLTNAKQKQTLTKLKQTSAHNNNTQQTIPELPELPGQNYQKQKEQIQ